jgi:hypothetical protein
MYSGFSQFVKCHILCFMYEASEGLMSQVTDLGESKSVFGDIELTTAENAASPVTLVLDLRIAHDRVGSSTDPTLSPDYNNNPPIPVSFMPPITSTSGRLHSEFIRLLFLQDHRETDRFFTTSGEFR